MTGYAELAQKVNRGWPWPEDSWGLTPMFGDDGWCRKCGTPKIKQEGSLVLQRKGLGSLPAAWMPNWQFEAICLEASFADVLSERFALDTLPIEWRGDPPGEARQIVPTASDFPFFDAVELRRAAMAKGPGKVGSECDFCGVWRWRPLPQSLLPPLVVAEEELGGDAVVAGPEWFGAGWKSYRQLVVRRDLAVAIAEASPRGFTVDELAWR